MKAEIKHIEFDTLTITIENKTELKTFWDWCNCDVDVSLINYCNSFRQGKTLLRNIKHIKNTIYHTIRDI